MAHGSITGDHDLDNDPDRCRLAADVAADVADELRHLLGRLEDAGLVGDQHGGRKLYRRLDVSVAGLERTAHYLRARSAKLDAEAKRGAT